MDYCEKVVDLAEDSSETLGYLVVGVVDESILYDVVEHFQMVLAELIEFPHFGSYVLVLFLHHSPEEVVLECFQKVAYFVSYYAQSVHEPCFVLHKHSFPFLFIQGLFVGVEKFPALGK